MDRRGFTLVELLVTLAVGTILLAIAIPGYAFLANANKLAAVTNELVVALQLARSEAVKRGQRVTVCKTVDATKPAPGCSKAAEWHSGWLVFVDHGVRGEMEVGDTLIHAHGGDRQATISATNFKDYVSYRPSGTSQGSSGLPNDTMRVCLKGSARKIIVNSTGRVRLEASVC